MSHELLDRLTLLSQKALPQNKKLVQHLKRKKPANLDKLIHTRHEEIFEKTDCLQCANCCKTTSPIFYQRDIERLAAALKVRPSAFISKYLRVDEDQDYVLQQSPCPFLDAENHCSVYDSRPAACREYPHTNRKKMVQLLDLSLKNAAVCPAVYTLFEKLKNDFLT
jgi:uncharacterized protein